MANYRAEVDEIMQKYNSGEYTIDEANEKLDGLDGVVDGKYGVGFYLDENKGKDCNAWMDCGVGGCEPIKVENGKVIHPTGMHPSYYIYYNGKTWHVSEEDNVTLIEGAPPKIETGKKPLPDLNDCMGRNKDRANQTIRTSTKQGIYDIHYNSLGYAVKATRV